MDGDLHDPAELAEGPPERGLVPRGAAAGVHRAVRPRGLAEHLGCGVRMVYGADIWCMVQLFGDGAAMVWLRPHLVIVEFPGPGPPAAPRHARRLPGGPVRPARGHQHHHTPRHHHDDH